MAVAVFFRTAAVAVALFGLFASFMPVLMLGTGIGQGTMLILFRIVGAYVVTAVVLWFISKPVASFVLSGLDCSDGPPAT